MRLFLVGPSPLAPCPKIPLIMQWRPKRPQTTLSKVSYKDLDFLYIFIVVILGSQCAVPHSASLRSAHWSSITTPPLRSAQLVSQNLWAKTWTQKLSAKNWAKTWGSKLEHKNLSSKLERINLSQNLDSKLACKKKLSQNLRFKTWAHKLEPQKLERKFGLNIWRSKLEGQNKKTNVI